MKKRITIALAGNPNSGKTTIFNNLTGARQKTGNWPGVTVEKKQGYRKHQEYDFKIIDLPGTYSLTPFSIEEITARDFILNEDPDIIVNIIDASNLERSLYLSIQIVELKKPALFVLNMADMAEAKGLKIDEEKLSQLLDLPVISTVGNKNKGIEDILKACIKCVDEFDKKENIRDIRYNNEIENCISILGDEILESKIKLEDSVRWNAIKILENDEIVKQRIANIDLNSSKKLFLTAKKCRKRIYDLFDDDFEIVMTEDRYGVISGIIKETVSSLAVKKVDTSRKIDLVLTNRFLGIPVFVFFIWAMFQLTFSLGEYPMEWIDSIVNLCAGFFDKILPDSLMKDLLLNGVITGIGSVVIFLPNILILFFCIALFEDTGYMARAAFLMDRVMHIAGLHGKSFIPMLMGFGCNVPAIMATRTLDNQKDRILTILMTPFMSCSARLPVYIILAGSFFEKKAGTIIFILYLSGIVIAILSGRLLKAVLFKGQEAPFILELPPYRMPMLKSLLIHMWDRSKMFAKKMGGIILIGSIIIWVLSSFPRINLEFSEIKGQNQQISQSYIGKIGKAFEPVFSPIGLEWKQGVALITGLFAKEVVVSTMGVLYGVDNKEKTALKKALQTSGMSAISAFSMMVFVLLYVPCFATITTIYKETSAKWACFNLIYTTIIAWVASFVVYRVGILIS